jgi:predicted phage tail protein
VNLPGAGAPPLGLREQGRPLIVLLGLAALPVAGALTFATGLAVGTKPEHIAPLALAIVTGMLALVPLILDQGRPAHRRHILITLVSLSWMVNYSLAIFTQYFLVGGYNPARLTQVSGLAPADLVNGQLAALIGLGLLLLAYALPIGNTAAAAFPQPKREWSGAAALAVAVVLIPLGWSIYLAGQFQVIPKRLGSGVLGIVANATIYGISLLTLIYLRHRSRLALLMLCAAIPPTMFFNFFTGSKGRFFAPLAMVALTYVATRRQIRVRWVIVGIVALALLYPAAEFYRQVVLEENTLTAITMLKNPEAALRRVSAYTSTFDFGEYLASGVQMTTGRFAGVGITSIILRDTPERVPYQGGWTIGYIFLSYVPRILWPGNPDMSIGQWVTDHYMGGPSIRSNTGPSWVGELYFNFGYLGIVVGMLVLGVYFRILHEAFFNPDATMPLRWVGVIQIYLTVPAVSGGVIAPINALVLFGGMTLVIHGIIRMLARQAYRAPTSRRSDC